MGLIVLGSRRNDYEEQPGAKWKVSQEGFDTFHIQLAGAQALLEDYFKAALAMRGRALAGFGGMYLTDVEDERTRSWGFIDLTYTGWRSGHAPNPLPSDKTGIQTASFTCTSPEEANRDISYISPATKWSYTTNRHLDVAVGFDVMSKMQPRILRSVITKKDGTRYTGLAPAPLVTALLRAPVVQTSDFSCDPVPWTPYFACEETAVLEYPSDT